MRVSKELLDSLNDAIAREIQVSIQYMLQHTLLSGAKRPAVENELPKSKQAKFVASHLPVYFNLQSKLIMEIV